MVRQRLSGNAGPLRFLGV